MKISVLGAGKVGSNLIKKLVISGNHDIFIGTRDTQSEKNLELTNLPNVTATTHLEAVENSDVVIISMHSPHIKELLPKLGNLLENKIVIDCSNEVFEKVSPDFDSATKAIMHLANAKGIAKAFNTTGAENILATKSGSIDTFIAGQEDAKAVAKELANEIGFNAVDAGGIDNAHALEEMARIWIAVCRPTGKFDSYFKVMGL